MYVLISKCFQFFLILRAILHTFLYFLILSHTFSYFLTLSHTFPHFLTLSHTFSHFLILSHTNTLALRTPCNTFPVLKALYYGLLIISQLLHNFTKHFHEAWSISMQHVICRCHETGLIPFLFNLNDILNQKSNFGWYHHKI